MEPESPLTIDLTGRLALVTGASRGIGRAVAITLARAGADVAINYRSDKLGAAQTADAVARLRRRFGVYSADVSRHEEVRAMRDEILRDLGAPAILVNNAGVNADRAFRNLDLESWERVIATNLTGAFNVVRIFLPDVAAAGDRGRIVNVSSIVGQAGNYGQANYAASKAGLLGLTRTLALELAAQGATVNAVAPGFIDTDMLAGVPPPVREKLVSRIPLKRFGGADEVASAVAFLASDLAKFVTGETLQVNGGQFMG